MHRGSSVSWCEVELDPFQRTPCSFLYFFIFSPFPEIDTLRGNYSQQISISHDNFKILKNNESLLCEVLQNKFGCNFTLVSLAPEGNNKSLRVFKKMLTPKVELSIWKDDLTRHAVDAVVNAANEELLHGGGLAQALVKAGGFEIQEESRALISKYGRIPTGEIVITGAGKLPCRKIIHAVGPRWSMMDSQECIDKLKTNHYDIVFLDHMMPQMDGKETLHRLKELKGHPGENAVIIALTANALVGARQEYINEGFDDFLPKPIIYNDALELILRYLPFPNSSVFDLNTEFTIDSKNFVSMGKATPFDGWSVFGKCLMTVKNGNIVWEAE